MSLAQRALSVVLITASYPGAQAGSNLPLSPPPSPLHPHSSFCRHLFVSFPWSPFLHSLSFSPFLHLSLRRPDLSFATNLYLISTPSPDFPSPPPQPSFSFPPSRPSSLRSPRSLARCPICARIECKGKEKNMYIDMLLYSRSRTGWIYTHSFVRNCR